MKRELYRLNRTIEPPEAFWMAITTIDLGDGDSGSVRKIDVMDLFGEPLDCNLSEFTEKQLREMLSDVQTGGLGSFSTPVEMIDLMTPTLVEKARERVNRELPYNEYSACNRAIEKSPYENACWILKATPEELQSWAITLANRT